jgi:hypothetical protein
LISWAAWKPGARRRMTPSVLSYPRRMSQRCGSSGWRWYRTSTTTPSSAVDRSTASTAALLVLARPQLSFESAALNCGCARAAWQTPRRLWPPGWEQGDSGITYTCPGHGYVIWHSFQFNLGTYMGVIGILWFVLQLCLKWSFHVLMARTLGDLCEMFFNVYSIRENLKTKFVALNFIGQATT